VRFGPARDKHRHERRRDVRSDHVGDPRCVEVDTLGLNTDGDVDGNDTFYMKLHCE
jgi:hypothetical protein